MPAATRPALWRRLRRRRVPALLAGIGLAVAALGVVAFEAGTFRRLELDSVDARFSIRGATEPRGDLVLVLVDDRTFDQLRLQWPFPRSRHARVIDAIASDRPRAIAYDVQFTEPTRPREDNALIAAVRRAGRVVLSTTETDGRGGTNVFGGDEVLRQIGARPGSTNYRTDPGGIFRRVTWEVDGLQTFGIVAAEVAAGKPIPPSALGGEDAWIDYAGPPGTVPAESFVDVLRGDVPPGRFRDKVVVVGASVPSLQDVHATSTSRDELMAGPEIQAQMAGTALNGFPLREAPGWLSLLAIVSLALITPLACLRLSPLRSAAVAVVAGLGYAGLAQLAFGADLILVATYPLIALVLSAALALAAQGSLTAVERARVRDVFARFVPGAVVDDVLARTDEDLRLGGVRREGTVMFSDLRGFTAFAEDRPPDEVIAFLNRYLAEMTEAIMRHGGTLVSFMGDGIMAVFGAPLDQPDHADRALAAAREMVGERLDRVNASLRQEGIADGFRMGLGLNSGEVLSGNVGSEQRLEYTALGDTTNTAARLEAATKATAYQALVAQSTIDLLRERPPGLEDLGELAIRGRARGVRVWGLR